MTTRTEAIKATEKELMQGISLLDGVSSVEYYHANEQIKIYVSHGFEEAVKSYLSTRCIGIFKFDKEVENHGYNIIYADYDLNAAPCPKEFIKSKIDIAVEVPLYELQTEDGRKVWSSGANGCAICGKKLSILTPSYFIHYLTNGNITSSFEECDNSQGMFPIGPDCAKRLVIKFARL